MNQIAVSLTPRRAALLEGAYTELEVLVSVAAPDAPASRSARAPLNVAIVIDRSGSMDGRPLTEAKRCAEFIVDHLGPDDRTAIVTFDSQVQVLASSRNASQKQDLLRAIRRLGSGGQTALHEGWLKGAELAAPHVSKGTIARVLLLTDGEANVGECRPDVIASDCARLAAAGVSTSTYGLGRSFNEKLMGAMADAGGGHAYYGETAEDLMDPFREEFDLLSSICARKVRLKLEPTAGVAVQVLNAYRTGDQGRTILPDIAYGSLAWALLKVRVPASLEASTPGGAVHVLTSWVEYESAEGRQKSTEPAHLRLPRVESAAYAALAEDGTVVARAQEVGSAIMLEDAREAAGRGDWDAVTRLLAAARAEAGENEWVASTLSALEEIAAYRDERRFSKEAYFSSRKQRMRLSEFSESRAFDPRLEAGKAGYLRRKPRQGKDLTGDSGS